MNYDIVIIGAGPAGLANALSLRDTDLRIAIIEQNPREQIRAPDYDGREIALTHFSRRILEDLGAWQQFQDEEVCKLKEAKVQDGKSPFTLDFDSKAHTLDALGYLVSNHVIRRALFSLTQDQANLEWHFDTSVTDVCSNDSEARVQLSDGQELSCSLVIAADSRFSESRRLMGISANMHDFGRTAILSRVAHDKSNNNTATECFQYGGTLAILPCNPHLSSIVLTLPTRDARPLMEIPETDFREDLQRRLEDKLGQIELLPGRHEYPLVGVYARQFRGTRFALVGDAAVGMHPVTAHGYNLGLQGQQTLSVEILSAHGRGGDIGAPAVLDTYQRKHRLASMPIYYGTNGIVRLFTDDSPPARMLRQGVLRASSAFAPIKWAITHKLTETRSLPGLGGR